MLPSEQVVIIAIGIRHKVWNFLSTEVIVSVQKNLIALIKMLSGQANVLTIPRVYLDLLNNDLHAALFLSQCVYWCDKSASKDGWFYKSHDDWEKELGLSRYQVDRIAELLSDIISKEVHTIENGETRLHWYVNVSKLVEKLFPEAESDELSEDNDGVVQDFNKQRMSKTRIPANVENSQSLKDIDYNIDYSSEGEISPGDIVTEEVSIIKNPRAFRALQLNEKKRANGGSDLSWLNEYLRPYADAFIRATGISPSRAERTRWRQALLQFHECQVIPEAIPKAVDKLRKDNRTIGDPGSVFKTARDLSSQKDLGEKKEVFWEVYT
jgi:hypothetical protein